MVLQTSDGFQPNGGKQGSRNSGTKDSINDRNCANCGKEGEHKQEYGKVPESVWCVTCGQALEIHSRLRMRPTPEEEERMAQEQLDRAAHASASGSAQRDARLMADREENPRPTRAQQKRRYAELVENCSRRPEPGGLLYNPLARLKLMLICACNCAINLVAAGFPPVVYMFFLSLFGCTCAKKGDIVAIPLEYVVYAVAVYTWMHENHVIDEWAFVSYRAPDQVTNSRLPEYIRTGFDAKYDDEEERFDSMRVSICAPTNKETLLPPARYRPKLDVLGEITSNGVGLSGVLGVEIPLIFRGEEIVLALKCRRRQVVMAFLSFACVAGALGTCLWSAAHVQDFEAFQNAVAAATIDNIIESSRKGQRGVNLVNKFVALYKPIFEMLQAFLIEAFGGRLPTEDEVEVLVNRFRGKVRLGECQLSDSAVAGRAASASESLIAGKVDALAEALREDLSPSRVTEAARTKRSAAWRFAYGARDYAYAAVAAVKRGVPRRRDDADDDDDCGSSKRLRVGEGMPSAADWDGSCKEVEPQGSTDPRAGVRRTNLLADIANHARRNAVHQIDFTNL